MRLGIIGTYSYVKEIMKQHKELLQSFSLHFYITDRNKVNLSKSYNSYSKHFSNSTFYNDLINFISNCRHLMIDAEETSILFSSVINSWAKMHYSGTLILSNDATIGYADMLSKKFKKTNENIEVLNYVFIKSQKQDLKEREQRLLILGGNIYSKYITQIRRYIASKKIPVLLVSLSDIEAIFNALKGSVLLKRAYLAELENFYEQNNLDIEIMKKALSAYDGFSLNNLNLPDDHFSDINNMDLITNAKKIIDRDNSWVTYLISFIQGYLQTPIRRITFWGRISLEELNRLNKLPVEQINIFSFRHIEIHSSKFITFHDKYSSLENADLLVINDYYDQFASISLKKLEEKMNQKIIIDRANLFELEEMKAQKWIYYSKGRRKVYNY